MCSNRKDISPILKELFPSAEMTSYLARCPFGDDADCRHSRHGRMFDDAPPEKLPLRRYTIADAIAGASISLERKRELFLLLAEGEEDGYFSDLADAVSLAIQEMQPKPGEFFYLTVCSYEEDIAHTREETMGAFLSWEQIFEAIQSCWGSDADFEELLTWFYVEKWTPDGNGRLKNKYSYEVIGGKVCYCCCEDLSVHKRLNLGGYTDPNLPVPFHAGDIVTVDCRPFAPVRHVVILEIGDNCDCCCLQALYYAGNGTWDTGAVKHGHIIPRYTGKLSPLYRLASFHGQLPEEERLLEKVNQYVSGEEERGSALWNYIFELCDGRMKRTVTEEQLLSYIGSNANTLGRTEKHDI